MLCPKCDLELKMSERQGVEIDYCVRCRGVWLDRGELDKIIERSVKQLNPTQPVFPTKQQKQRYDDDHYYDDRKYYKKKKKKRKSLLEEIFDF